MEEPGWLNRPAVSRLTVSTANLLEPFEDRNEGRTYQEKIKPTNFMLVAHTGHYGTPSEVDSGEPFQLIGPYTPDPSRWKQMEWFDKYGRGAYYITTSDRGTAERVRVQSYRDVFERYRRKPEVTALASDGELFGKQARGVLQPRPVDATTVIPIGKESNQLDEVQAGAVAMLDEVQATYDHEKRLWEHCLQPNLAQLVQERSKAHVANAVDVSTRTFKHGSMAVPSLLIKGTETFIDSSSQLRSRVGRTID